MLRFLSHCIVAFAVVAPACQSPPPARVDHAVYDRVLKACVRDGGVDYLVLRRDHKKELDAYLDSIAAQSWPAVDTLPPDEQLVLFLNLYNATVMRAVASRIRVGYTVAENDFALFKEKLVRIGGESISLDHLEKEIIQKRFGEPRIHAALVCASKSCPPLEAAAFAADTVTSTMDGNMQRFLGDPAKNSVDSKTKTVKLSPIFQWNAAEFGGEEKLDNFASKYVGADVTDYKVEFGDYDWSLNQAKLAPGHPWRAVIASDASLKMGEIVEELGAEGSSVKIRRGDGRETTIDRAALTIWRP